jgi:hypothetical protein
MKINNCVIGDEMDMIKYGFKNGSVMCVAFVMLSVGSTRISDEE